MFPGEDCPKNDVHIHEQVETIEACIEFCNPSNGCNAVTWIPGRHKECILKNNNCDKRNRPSQFPNIVSARVFIAETATTSTTTTITKTITTMTTMFPQNTVPMRTHYSSGSTVAYLFTKTVAHELKICEDWELSVNLFLLNKQPTKWRNIFGLQVDGTGHSEAGARVPALWIVPRSQSTDFELMTSISNAVGAEPFHHYHFHVTAETWFNLKLSQTNEVYSIRVDGSLIHQEGIAETKIWDNVNVVFGNLYDYQDDNHISAEGRYQNFEINSCHNEIQN